MNIYKQLKDRLGISYLVGEWKTLLNPKYFSNDLSAGITVAFIAIPLSLAIALASGVSPATGLITAIIAGVVCALFGGTPLAVSGPAAAMAVLIADVVEKFGVTGLTLICLIAGILQFVSGFLGLGKLGRYVPLPVIAGFTAGIGVIILIGQLPRAFGLMPPPESHVLDVLTHVKQYFHDINGACLFIVIATLVIIRGLPKIFPKIPAILIGVIVATLLVYILNLNSVPLIGDIPRSLPSPQIPTIPNTDLTQLFISAFTVFVLASLETLLSSSAVDKLVPGGKKHNANQELLGQGLGNIAVSLFSGIPVTGVIARSVTNIRAGAKTQRSSIVHSLIILLAVWAIAPLIALIPIAALAAVLFSIAFSMINYKEFHGLWLTSRAEAGIYVITFLTIIFVDLIAGVQAGIAAACIIILYKAARTRMLISNHAQDDILRLSLSGSLTFLSTGKMAELEQTIEAVRAGQTILIDLSGITNLDTTGAGAIIDLYNQCQEQNIQFYITGVSREFELLIKGCGGEYLVEHHSLMSENELREKSGTAPQSARGRLIHGVHRFYNERKENDKRLFEFIKQKQDPHTLFITCSDSRIIPSQMTSAEAGELFIIRNVGNVIPPYQPYHCYSEAAALDFSLGHLNITDVVICGHANCGAIRACMLYNDESLEPNLTSWINMIRSQLSINDKSTLTEVTHANILNQVENLKNYPIVQRRLKEGTLNIHAWFFDFDQHIVLEWNNKEKQFKSMILESTSNT